MRLLISGATGLIGRRLVIDRLERGDQVVIVSRNGQRAADLFAADANPNVEVVEGNPSTPGDWQKKVDGLDAVIHLAGAGIADKRWTKAYKEELYNSRVDSTYQMARAIAEAPSPPGVFVTASAIGYYGETGVAQVDETGRAGSDFLADLCVQWEKQAAMAASEQTRVVMMRTGAVLDERGGAIAQMVPVFRYYIGGPLGIKRTYISWIHWRDLVNMYDFALRDARLNGPVNATAPNPCSNGELAQAVAAALNTPS